MQKFTGQQVSYLGPAPSPSVLAHMPIESDAFARTLIRLGERHLLSQEERADKIGISARQYARWEEGQVVPRLSNVRRVAAAYNIDPTLFLAELSDDSGSLEDRLDRIEQALFLLLEDRGLTHAGEMPEPPADLASRTDCASVIWSLNISSML